jgi:hypothetical protein
MKALQDRTWQAERHRLEADLGACIETVFDRCPMLCGFSVGQRGIESKDTDAGVAEFELFISGIDIYPLGWGQSDELCKEISTALVDLLSEHPDAVELLCDRTFARSLH